MSEHRWYAIQTTAGHENKVRSLIDRRIKDDPRPDEEKPIRQALVPTQEVVEITEGPFSDFSGTVEEVIRDKGKVRVAVALFGRPTSVELDYLQLKAH